MKHFLSLANLSSKEMHMLINKGIAIKKNPSRFSSKLKGKTLILLFDEPSLRTRISFEAGMLQLGGHAITYHLSESTVGKKESPKDFSQIAVAMIVSSILRPVDVTTSSRSTC